MERIQRLAFYAVLLFVILGIAAALGLTLLPKGIPALTWSLHPLVLLLGGGCGYCAVARSREIERERWRVVADDMLTSGEREYAHREAELQTRSTARVFLLAALSMGFWFSYQLRQEGSVGPGDFLIVSSFAGFLLGALIGSRRLPREEPR